MEAIKDGVPRNVAAELTGVALSVLRYWEASGVLEKRGRGRGRWTPALYSSRDIITARAVAFLRSQGASLQKVRAARRALAALLPGIERDPKAWRLAVRGDGHVCRVSENGAALLELTKSPGQTAWPLYVVDVRATLRDVRQRAAELQAAGA